MSSRTRPSRTPRGRDRVVAGVASGWADRWGVEPTVVRASLGLLTLVGGIGIVLYGIAAAWSSSPSGARRSGPLDHRRHAAITAFTGAVLVAARSIGLWPGDEVMIPAIAVAAGTAVAWTIAPGSPREADGQRSPVTAAVQVVAGIALLGAGVISLARRTGGLANVGASAAAIAVVLGGLAMFAAPSIGRLLRSLDDERSMRIREDERATVAAHLHDSVLQSLVLMQRTDDPKRMASLARRQERELRAWLYGVAPVGEAVSLHGALGQLAVEVESDHDVRVELVIVGDQPLDHAARTLVAAVREALVNAARHADVDHVDVFVEADDTELTGFVRDTGRGFDRAQVPDDRRGISESILGRVERAGGTATLVSQLGTGTEVELRVPRGGR